MGFQFFVYGSFANGQVHHNKISEFIVDHRAGFVKGEIVRLPSGFPFACLGQPQNLIPGQVVDLEVPDSFWPIMDQLLGVNHDNMEKSLFQRHQVEAMVDNFTQIPCHIYTVNSNRLPKGCQKIEDGDWQKNLDKGPPLVNYLTPRQKQYLIKLALSKGREIIPIKLDLYRELTSLELVVDKGRRLALTPLGKEVSLFLQ